MFALSAVAVSTTLCTATGETVEFVNDYLLERAAVRVGYHFLKVGAVVVRSRARFVLVGFYNGVALTFCVLGANANLPLDRLLVLSLRRITRINDCVFHCDLLLCAVCVCADCGLKILLFALVLTVLTSQKRRRSKIVKGLPRRGRRFYA